jgi:hypothetical protein
LPIKAGRRCRATLILGPRSNAALPEWSFVNQPDKQGFNLFKARRQQLSISLPLEKCPPDFLIIVFPHQFSHRM